MHAPLLEPIPWQDPLIVHQRLSARENSFCLCGGKPDLFYLGANPLRTLRFEIGEEEQKIKGESSKSNRAQVLEDALLPRLSGNPSPFFSSGWVGFLGYEFFHSEEIVSPDLKNFLVGWCGLYDPIYILDSLHQKAWIASWGLDEKGIPHLKRAQERIRKEKESYMRDLWALDSLPLLEECSSHFQFQDYSLLLAFEEYRARVQKILEYLHAGDCYQVNFCNQFRGRIPLGCSLSSLFWEFFREYPAPFSAFLDCGTHTILSYSPEEFFTVQRDAIRTRPIKGSRRRGSSLAEDQRICRELIQSEKDRSELLMIIDLERNDLAKICKPNSVRVPSLGSIETHGYVHHRVATIEAELEPSTDWIAIFRAMFPGGSITGAPKLRAMEILSELEGSPRGVYTGAIGFIDHSSLAQFNIAIRTFEFKKELAQKIFQVRYGAGGGILAESDPDAEWEEMLVKAKPFFSLFRKRE